MNPSCSIHGAGKHVVGQAFCHSNEWFCKLCDDTFIDGPPPVEPKFLILCTLEGRKDGAVTVAESRLPVASVLATIRARGTAEARSMWPQLTEDELAVLTTLVADIDMRTVCS